MESLALPIPGAIVGHMHSSGFRLPLLPRYAGNSTALDAIIRDGLVTISGVRLLHFILIHCLKRRVAVHVRHIEES